MMGRQLFEYVNTRHRNSTFCEVYIKIKQICCYNFVEIGAKNESREVSN